MRASSANTPPPRSGLKRLISPWEYRHVHASMAVRFAGGGFQLGIGLVLISLGRKAETDAERRKCYRLAAWFLVPAVGNFLGGLLDLSVARTAPPPS
jgi:low temperature requirement protein LtrA